MIKNISVFCASSSKVAEVYKSQTRLLGSILADAGIHCFYGGGCVGLMGELAESMLEHKGSISGVIPQFMVDEGWSNDRVEEIIVPDMNVRKSYMMEHSDAIVALPGGCGTLEELLVAITSRQLGLIKIPIVIVNIDGFFNPLIQMLNKAIEESFMRPEYKSLWLTVSSASDVLTAIDKSSQDKFERGRAAM